VPATITSLLTKRTDSPTRPAHRWHTGRSAHPSNPIPASRGLDSALSFDALIAIASGLAWAQEPVPGDADGPGGARSIRLIATALYDVWLITWPKGSNIGPHDHGGARSVLQVVKGELIETFADGPEGGPSRTRVLRKGDAVCGEPPFLHDLANRSGTEATSLHVYSPPLSDLTLFPTLRGDHVRTITVAERLPRASSSDRLAHEPEH